MTARREFQRRHLWLLAKLFGKFPRVVLPYSTATQRCKAAGSLRFQVCLSCGSTLKSSNPKGFQLLPLSNASCCFCFVTLLGCYHAWFPPNTVPPPHPPPLLLLQAAEYGCYTILFSFSVAQVGPFTLPPMAPVLKGVGQSTECSRVARYANLFGAESERTPTNNFLRTGRSQQGSGRSPA